MPPAAKMRHDAHYVEEITSRGGIAIGRMIPIEEIEPTPASHGGMQAIYKGLQSPCAKWAY